MLPARCSEHFKGQEQAGYSCQTVRSAPCTGRPSRERRRRSGPTACAHALRSRPGARGDGSSTALRERPVAGVPRRSRRRSPARLPASGPSLSPGQPRPLRVPLSAFAAAPSPSPGQNWRHIDNDSLGLEFSSANAHSGVIMRVSIHPACWPVSPFGYSHHLNRIRESKILQFTGDRSSLSSTSASTCC